MSATETVDEGSITVRVQPITTKISNHSFLVRRSAICIKIRHSFVKDFELLIAARDLAELFK